MSVTVQEIAELRAEGALLDLTNFASPLTIVAEIVAYTATEMRGIGMEEAAVLDNIELVLRAVQVDQQALREARAVLKALHYDAKLIALLTRLARKAKPKQVWRPPGWNGPRTRAVHPPARQGAPAETVDHGALAMWSQPKAGPTRR